MTFISINWNAYQVLVCRIDIGPPAPLLMSFKMNGLLQIGVFPHLTPLESQLLQGGMQV